MVMQGNHEEIISLFLIDSPAFPVVLGLPWLALHNPTISWQQRALTGWSREVSGRCLGVSVGDTTVESPDQVSTVRIPPEYADLALAFSKKKATQLPPHRRGDYRWVTEYLVMPLSLTKAPAVFQNLVNDVLRDVLGRFVLAYLQCLAKVFGPLELCDLLPHFRLQT